MFTEQRYRITDSDRIPQYGPTQNGVLLALREDRLHKVGTQLTYQTKFQLRSVFLSSPQTHCQWLLKAPVTRLFDKLRPQKGGFTYQNS
jgi:hypothetical protein